MEKSKLLPADAQPKTSKSKIGKYYDNIDCSVSITLGFDLEMVCHHYYSSTNDIFLIETQGYLFMLGSLKGVPKKVCIRIFLTIMILLLFKRYLRGQNRILSCGIHSGVTRSHE